MHVDDWFDEIKKQVNQSTAKILIGNKCDLESERKVSTDEGKKKAEELGMSFLETSAKDATNVGATFHVMSTQLIQNRDHQNASGQNSRGGMGLLTPKNPKPNAGACAG